MNNFDTFLHLYVSKIDCTKCYGSLKLKECLKIWINNITTFTLISTIK